MKIKLPELNKLITDILTSTHYNQSQAQDIAEVLMYAEKTAKNTQGILKLLGKEPIQSIQPKYEPKIIKDTKLSSLIDGGGNPGILVSRIATKQAIQKAKDNGFGIVGTNNTFSSTGVIGFYAEEMAENNLIGIVMAGSPPVVAPYGSIEVMFGTNPIAFGFPTETDPLIFDMATSAITWYGLVRAKALGEKIPEGVAIDSEGNITTDPAKAMDGAVLTFDKGAKGSGLSMVVQLFTNQLVGTGVAGDWGTVFIAIDPELLIGTEIFKKNASLLINQIKTSKPIKVNQKVRVSGQHGLESKIKIEEAGEIDIEDKLLEELKSKLTS